MRWIPSKLRSSPVTLLIAEAALVLLAYGVLVYGFLFPLFSAPDRLLINPMAPGGTGNFAVPDVYMMIWVMAWGWHSLTTDPSHFFDGNLFYPAPLTVAGAEHMLGNLPLFGPIYAISGNPVLATQMNLWLAFAMCGATTYALLRHWNVSRPAAFFGGFVYALCPVRVHFGPVNTQCMTGQYLPLVLLYLDRSLFRRSAAAACSLAVVLLLQLLCGYYLAYMALTAIVGYGLGVLWQRRGRLPLRGVLLAATGGFVACAFVALISLPYLQRKHLGAIPAYPMDALIGNSANLYRGYLYPPIAIREWGWSVFQGLSFTYVGLLPLSLAAMAALSWRRQPKDRPGWALAGAVGLTLMCYVLSLGPAIEIGGRRIDLPYKLAMDVIPGFSSMRGPARYAYVLMLGIALLAAMGLDRGLTLLRRFGDRRWVGPLVAALAILLTAGEYDLLRFRYGVGELPVGEKVPAVYRTLAQLPRGPVLELPAHGLESFQSIIEESQYAYYSTFHWFPMLNGYSQYPPPTQIPMLAVAQRLPDPASLDLLARATGLRYLIVHTAMLPPAEQGRWANPAGLELIGSNAPDLLFRLKDPPPADLLPAFIDFEPAKYTPLGTPLETLPTGQRQNFVNLADGPPQSAPWGLTLPLRVLVSNWSTVSWPSFSPITNHLVTLGYRWEDASGNLLIEDLTYNRLPFDLGPAASVQVDALIAVPQITGPQRLYLGLVQDGVWFPNRLGPLSVTVRPLFGS